MKLLTQSLFFSIVMVSLFSEAATPVSVEACFNFKGRDQKTYISKISVNNDTVSVTDYNLNGDYMGSMRGRALDMTVRAHEVEIRNLTLNDQDAWIDKAYIKITKSTVTYDTPEDRKGPQRIVSCPQEKQRSSRSRF